MTLHLLLAFLLLIEVPLLYWRAKSGDGIARTGVQMMGFTLCCQVVFYLYAIGTLADPDNPCAFGSETEIPGQALSVFGALFGVFLLSDTLCARVSGGLGSSRQEFAALLRQSGKFIPFAAFGSIAYLGTYLMVRDLGILWSNSAYVLMFSPDAASIDNSFARLMPSLQSPVFFATCIFLAIAIVLRRVAAASVLFACATVFFVIAVSGASRSGMVGIALYTITYSILTRRIGLGTILLGLFALYTLQAVLIGRGLGAFGVSNFFGILAAPLSQQFDLTLMMKNLFQGGVSIADGILIRAEFAPIYKWLSLSPFPSFIDGFDQIRRNNEVRLHNFCPMGGIAEVAHFGPLFWFLVGAQYVVMVAAINSTFMLRRVGTLPVICANLIFTVFTIIAFTYPLRNTLRPLTYTTIALLLLAAYLGTRRVRRRAEPQVPPAELRRRMAAQAEGNERSRRR